MKKLRYPDDCRQVQKNLLLFHSIAASLEECQDFWDGVSEDACAGWLHVPEDPDEWHNWVGNRLEHIR